MNVSMEPPKPGRGYGALDISTPLTSGTINSSIDTSKFPNDRSKLGTGNIQIDVTTASEQESFTPSTKLLSRPFLNGADKIINIGDYIFLHDAIRNVDTPSSNIFKGETVASIQTVNFFLEEGSRESRNRRASEVGFVRPYTGLQHKIGTSQFCADSVENAHKKWRGLGVVLSINNAEGKDRMMGVALDKPVITSNLWYDADIGDHVGFILKEIKNNLPRKYNVLGQEAGNQDDHGNNIVQFVPITLKSSKTPYNNCGLTPDGDDMAGTCYIKSEVLKTKEYAICTKTDRKKGVYAGFAVRTQTLNMEERVMEQTVQEYNLTQYGIFISVGRVHDIYGQKPSREEAMTATRSRVVYNKMWNEGKKLSVSVKRSELM